MELDPTMTDDIVIGLLFGDEGKGTTVDFYSKTNYPKSVVKFSGGSQTAHNVVTPDGKHHTFAQLGSGSFYEIPTTITKHALVDPFNLIVEGMEFLEKSKWNPFMDMRISESCLVTTPLHVWLNKKREEKRYGKAHGSCALGVGETRLYAIRHPEQALKMKDLTVSGLVTIKEKLVFLKNYVEQEAGETCDENIDELVNAYTLLVQEKLLTVVDDARILEIIADGYHVFEGTQGVLLDEAYGFFPHTTWTSVVADNAQKLLKEAGKQPGKVTGVIRSYLTRHGNGPFPSELNTNEQLELFPELHNGYGRYQGGWRRGLLDLKLLEYALAANPVDALMITHMDRVFNGMGVVKDYAGWEKIPTNFYSKISAELYEVDRTPQVALTNKLNSLTLQDAVVEKISSEKDLVDLVFETTKKPIEFFSYGPCWTDKTNKLVSLR